MRITQATLLATLALAAVPALAQRADNASARNGNVWNGTNHQPTAGDVHARERDAGIAPSNEQAQQEEQDLDRIGRQLTDRANRGARQQGGAGGGTGR